MDFRQIEAFVAVYRLRNFSRAGKALFVTQPTISTHINELETELGMKLFDRSSRDVIPTEAGDIFYQYAVNLLETRDSAISCLNQHARQVEGRMEIAASTIPSQYLLPKVIRQFQGKNPKIVFCVHEGSSREIIRDIQENRYQVGIVGARIEDQRLDYELLTQDRLVLITAGKDKGQDSEITIESLLEKKFILRERGSGTREEFELALRKNGIDPDMLKVVAEMNSIEAIKRAVSEGIDVAVVSSLCVEEEISAGAIKTIRIKDFEVERSFYLVTYRNRPLSPSAIAFREFILDYFHPNTP